MGKCLYNGVSSRCKCVRLFVLESQWKARVHGGKEAPQLTLGPFVPACTFCVNVRSHTSQVWSFPLQDLLTCLEKCTVIILIYNWDSERWKNSPHVTQPADEEARGDSPSLVLL